MKQFSFKHIAVTSPVSVQPLIGGRFVRITVWGTSLETSFVLTATQTIALAKALAESIYAHNQPTPHAIPDSNHRTPLRKHARQPRTPAK